MVAKSYASLFHYCSNYAGISAHAYIVISNVLLVILSFSERWSLPALHGKGGSVVNSPARNSMLETHQQDPLLVASTPLQMYSLFGHTTEKIEK